MSKTQILEVMGTDAYRFPYKDITVYNPYKVETWRDKDGVTYEVLFYYTDKKKHAEFISDDELTPLFLRDGKLAGWGRSCLGDNVIKVREEINVR